MIAVENKVPVLRFPEFESEWEVAKLGEIAKITSGGTPNRAIKKYWDGDIPWITTTLINFNTIHQADEYITEEGVRNSSAKMFPVGTLLMAMYGQGHNRGKIAMLGIEATTNQACAAIIPNTSLIDNLYLFQNLAGRYEEIRELSNAGGQENLSGTIIKNIDCSFSSLPEQQKIAAFLTAVDAKIELLTKKKTLLEQYKKGVMQQLFSQKIRFKDDKGEDFPNWEEKRLGEITYKVDKKNKNKELLPIYSISNINGFIPQGEQFDGMDSNERGYDISLYKIVEKQTFAYNPARINVGSIGYSGDLGRVIVSSLYVCFKTSDIVNDQFFNYFLQTEHFKTSVLRNGEGGVRIYLSYENFSQITIMLPSIKEQIFISNFIYTFDTKIGLVSNQLEYTKTFKKSLLQQMFV